MIFPLLFVWLKLPFTKGQLIFALVFTVVFIIAMVLAYSSDAKTNKLYYKNVWLVLVSIIAILAAMILLVKVLH